MSQTLYRKYRPQTFAEVEGQAHIVRTLQGALASGRPGQAYLFCGPRGTGKTSVARIFAKAVNCLQRGKGLEPCNACHFCLAVSQNNSLDLIEIDAASRTGVDDIRELNESARVAASGGRHKLFLIDEVHMLSKSAFNALLKTLEEPPAQVIFILATTEPHKLLDTILSRVQRLDFKPITSDRLAKKLQRVAQQEKIQIEDEAVAALANYASGSLRDAESALAKLIAYGGDKITVAHTAEILGIVPAAVHEQLLAAIADQNAPAALALVSRLYEEGVDLENFNKQFVTYARTKLIDLVGKPAGNGQTPAALVKVINVFVKAKQEFKHSPLPPLPLELAVLELINGQP